MSAENLLPGCAAAATARHTGTHTPFAPEHKPLVPLGALLLAASVSSWAQTPPEATLSTVTVKEKAEVQNKDTVLTRKTTIGKGAPNKEGGHDVHGAPLGAAEIAATLDHMAAFAHLAGAVAARTLKPVLGVPLTGSELGGMDALLATVMMPPGYPVGTLALDKVGARNAAWLAAQILALTDPALAERLRAARREFVEAVEQAAAKLKP